MTKPARKTHSLADFDLDLFSGDLDLFRWFFAVFFVWQADPLGECGQDVATVRGAKNGYAVGDS